MDALRRIFGRNSRIYYERNDRNGGSVRDSVDENTVKEYREVRGKANQVADSSRKNSQRERQKETTSSVKRSELSTSFKDTLHVVEAPLNSKGKLSLYVLQNGRIYRPNIDVKEIEKQNKLNIGMLQEIVKTYYEGLSNDVFLADSEQEFPKTYSKKEKLLFLKYKYKRRNAIQIDQKETDLAYLLREYVKLKNMFWLTSFAIATSNS